jgi:hypothetical protein
MLWDGRVVCIHYRSGRLGAWFARRQAGQLVAADDLLLRDFGKVRDGYMDDGRMINLTREVLDYSRCVIRHV